MHGAYKVKLPQEVSFLSLNQTNTSKILTTRKISCLTFTFDTFYVLPEQEQ